MKANPNAFARARSMMAAIAEAMAHGLSANSVGPYVSRGKGRGRLPSPRFGNARGKYTPHIGAKEQERAKRFYMQPSFYHANGITGEMPRSAPILCQISKQKFF